MRSDAPLWSEQSQSKREKEGGEQVVSGLHKQSASCLGTPRATEEPVDGLQERESLRVEAGEVTGE